jgi:hypothetical protein
MGRARFVSVVLVALAWCPLARGGEAEKPPCHSLRGIFGRSSFDLKKRPLYANILLYVPNRLYDVLDCIGLEAGAGKGAHVNIRLTRMLQFAYGREQSLRAGLVGRRPLMVDQQLEERAIAWWWQLDLRRETVMGAADDIDIGEADAAKEYYSVADPTAIGVSVFPGIVGLSAELRGHELLDLLLGLLTIDPLDDDQ